MRNSVLVGLAIVVLLATVTGGVVADDPEHEHPDDVDVSGNPWSLQRWFGGEMGEIHVDCSEGMAVGNFDVCEDLDDEYESYLERYVSVERETTSNESERNGDDFEETADEQQELAEEVQEFEETQEEYEDAREAGDESRARSRAREMNRQAERINELGGNVSAQFRDLDDATSADLEIAATRTNETVRNVTRTAQQATEEALEATVIDVESDFTASYATPSNVTGAVRTETGNAVASGTVVLTDDAGVRRTTTVGEDGSFETAYRPAMTSVGVTTVSVAYVPDDESPYLGTNASMAVEVQQTETTVSIEEVTDTAAYNESVTVTGTVTAAGDSPGGVPVRVRIRDREIAVGTTDQAGRFNVTGWLPASVPVGNLSVAVRSSAADAALAPATETETIAVTETETTLSAATQYSDDRVELSGQLATVDGVPVGGQPVTIAIGDEGRTVETNAQGRYSLTVDRPGERRAAVIRYEEVESNLAGSQTRLQIEPQANDSTGVVPSEQNELWQLVDRIQAVVLDHPIVATFVAVVAVTSLGIWAFVAWRRFVRGGDDTGEQTIGESGDLEPAVRRVTDDVTGLEAARRQLEGAPSTAVQLAFASVRSALGVDDSRTHWEVYRAASEDLDGERREALRAVTEAFEAATFSPEGVDRDRASRAVDDAERCLSAPDGGEPRE